MTFHSIRAFVATVRVIVEAGLHSQLLTRRHVTVDPATTQLTHTLLDGFDQGTAKVVTIGTSAAAAEAWNWIRTVLLRRQSPPDSSEPAVLAAQPGEEVDFQTLLRLLQTLVGRTSGGQHHGSGRLRGQRQR